MSYYCLMVYRNTLRASVFLRPMLWPHKKAAERKNTSWGGNRVAASSAQHYKRMSGFAVWLETCLSGFHRQSGTDLLPPEGVTGDVYRFRPLLSTATVTGMTLTLNSSIASMPGQGREGERLVFMPFSSPSVTSLSCQVTAASDGIKHFWYCEFELGCVDKRPALVGEYPLPR